MDEDLEKLTGLCSSINVEDGVLRHAGIGSDSICYDFCGKKTWGIIEVLERLSTVLNLKGPE